MSQGVVSPPGNEELHTGRAILDPIRPDAVSQVSAEGCLLWLGSSVQALHSHALSHMHTHGQHHPGCTQPELPAWAGRTGQSPRHWALLSPGGPTLGDGAGVPELGCEEQAWWGPCLCEECCQHQEQIAASWGLFSKQTPSGAGTERLLFKNSRRKLESRTFSPTHDWNFPSEPRGNGGTARGLEGDLGPPHSMSCGHQHLVLLRVCPSPASHPGHPTQVSECRHRPGLCQQVTLGHHLICGTRTEQDLPHEVEGGTRASPT